MSSLTWYELLGVERDASPAEIKAAWRDATDKFEPGSGARQFSLFNEAADVLLNPESRAAYDAELAGDVIEPEPDKEPDKEPEPEPEADVEPEPAPVEEPVEVPPTKVGFLRRGVLGKAYNAVTSTLGLGILAVLTVASIVLASVLFFRADLSEKADISVARAEAQSVARRAMAVALSYDYRHLEDDRAAAISYMTPGYAAKFSKPFDAISKGEGNSPATAVAQKTVVEGIVQDVGVIDAGKDRVRLLVYVDQKVTNIDGGPVVFENQVVVTLVHSGGKWLIDDLQQSLDSDCPLCADPSPAPGATPTATPKP